LLLLVLGSLLDSRSIASAAVDGLYTTQLNSECDALLRLAIHRPYGWAWDPAAASEMTGHPSPRPVSMQSLATPAAGLLLLRAGALLNEPRYIEAAQQVARGISASEMPTGRIRANPIFGPVAGGREEQSVIADRTATRCGLGLLLALVDQSKSSTQPTDAREEAIRRAAQRAARWLAKQEAPNGLWPTAFPASAQPVDTMRIVRLDDADYRDSTFALLLSAELLQDETLHHFTIGPLDGLLKVRLVSDVHGPGLWSTACTVDGTDIPTGFPNGPDLLASRYAMQTLLAGYLITGEGTLSTALDQAATTLTQVKRPDGSYDRFLDPTAAGDMARSLAGSDAGTTHFFASTPSTKPSQTPSVLASRIMSGDFGIAQLVDADGRLKAGGHDGYIDSLGGAAALHDEIEASLCGLSDDPMSGNFPRSAAEVPAYIAAHADLWKVTEGPVPDGLAGRVKRVWVLMLRVRLERLANAKPE
jgi:hypothetical protein